MKEKIKDRIITTIILVAIAAGVAGYINVIFCMVDITKLQKENKELWTSIESINEEISSIRELQHEQGDVVIQIADKINGAVMVGISDKEVLEEMKRREAYIAE